MQIKFNPLIYGETAQIAVKASLLNGGYSKSSKGEIAGLPTVTEYIEKETEIKTLIDSYTQLVLKDVKSVNDMMRSADNMDQKLHQAFMSVSSAATGTLNGGSTTT